MPAGRQPEHEDVHECDNHDDDDDDDDDDGYDDDDDDDGRDLGNPLPQEDQSQHSLLTPSLKKRQ